MRWIRILTGWHIGVILCGGGQAHNSLTGTTFGEPGLFFDVWSLETTRVRDSVMVRVFFQHSS